jgi:hypothetical protein
MRINGWNYAVVGTRTPFLGRGGGQFANHSREKQNCVIVVKTTKSAPGKWTYFGVLSLNSRKVLPILILYATRDILKGEEVFWNYPAQTVLRFGLTGATGRDLAPIPTRADKAFDLASDEMPAEGEGNPVSTPLPDGLPELIGDIPFARNYVPLYNINQNTGLPSHMQ